MSNVKDLALFGDAITSTSTGIKLNEANALALSAYNKTIGTVAVDAFIYDTSKDSDGGAWRKRTEHTSWYNETLNTATRGSRREFPAVAVIVAESNKVTIYDGDEPDCPMWMVFNNGENTFFWTNSILSITAKNGILCVAANRINEINFISDSGTLHDTAGFFAIRSNISDRDVVPASTPIISSQSIVNNAVNDVAMTVLPSAPIDDATGLPVPTIAVATDGGVSVIKDDGTVVDITISGNAAYNYMHNIKFSGNDVVFSNANISQNYPYVRVVPIPSADISYSFSGSGVTEPLYYVGTEAGWVDSLTLVGVDSTSSVEGVEASGNFRAIGVTAGLNLIEEDRTTPSNGMIAHTTSSYNTGWMPGDIKLATLSDTTEETIGSVDYSDGSELVTNGTFDTDISGWDTTRTNTGILSTYNAGKLRVQREDGVHTGTDPKQSITTVSGKTYRVTFDATLNVSANGRSILFVLDSINGQFINFRPAGSGTHSIVFRAQGASTDIVLTVDSNLDDVEFDNASVVEVAELVENGEFTYNTTGWTFEGTGTDTSAPGYLEYTAGGATNLLAYQIITTEIGKLYYVEADYVSGTNSGAIYIGTAPGGANSGSTQFELGGNKVYNTFKATTTTTYISLMAGAGTETGRFDNVSVKEADELVENGDFGRLTTGWTASQSSIVISGDTIEITPDAGVNGAVYQAITTEIGKRYVASCVVSNDVSSFARFHIGTSNDINSVARLDLGTVGQIGNTTASVTFTATTTTTYVWLEVGGGTQQPTNFDNVSVRLAEADRSSYQDGLQIHGQLTKSAVAPGAELVAYSGFSANNYLIGHPEVSSSVTQGALCAWVKHTGAFSTQEMISVRNAGNSHNISLLRQTSTGDKSWGWNLTGDGGSASLFSTDASDANQWYHLCLTFDGNNVKLYINGALNTNTTDTYSPITMGSEPTVQIGNNPLVVTSDDFSATLVRFSESVPTAEQIKKIYEDERKLFQEDAKCTIYGSSDNVTALAYDDKYKQLHVGTSAGRSVFNGLIRAENTTTAVATVISANNKMVAEQ